MAEYLGWWETDAPLSPEQAQADRTLLETIWIPAAVTMRSATVYVDGHEWQYRSQRIDLIGRD